MNRHEQINDVELPSSDLAETKRFFHEDFGWEFGDYGPGYIAFSGQGLDRGFYLSSKVSSSADGAALVVFYSERLGETRAKIESAGGELNRSAFSFPGGRRFHFTDPVGNGFAAWSDR